MNIAIVGYGNLGRGVESAVINAPDMNLVGIYTRRNPGDVEKNKATDTPVFDYKDLINHKENIDVVILCGGSATDLPEMTPEIAKNFCVVDSFDTHANILEHLNNVETEAKAAGTLAVISAGWDPGLFSLSRLYANAALPRGKDYTFWGRGVSQGHSDAIRRIPGVLDARQYTVPIEESLAKVRSGEMPELSTREKHLRECYVVAEAGADLDKIQSEIVNMPNYFADYDTTVTFVSQEELDANHSGMPHAGNVFRTGQLGADGEFNNTIEFSLSLESNPYFTGSILAACGRAVYKMHRAGASGCITLFDIPPIMLLPENREEIIGHML